MAQPALEKFIRRALALKLQDLEGTPVAPSNSTDGVRLYDGQSGTEVDSTKDNPDVPHFAGASMFVFNKRAFIEGMFRLYPPSIPGDAVDGSPDCHSLLLPAGMTRVLNAGARTTRYNPISAGIPLSTANWFHAGTVLNVFDARHAISGLMLEIGKRFEGKIRVQGTYEDIDEISLPTVTVSDQDGPVVQSFNGVTQITVLPGGSPLNVWGKSLSLDFGSDLKTKEYTELKTNTIDGRDPKFTLRCARTAKADFDPTAVRDASGFITASLRVKGSDGRYAKMGIRGQIESVKAVDIDGDYGYEISGMCVASSAGGDEFYIEFGDVSLALTGTLSDGENGVAYSGTTSLTEIGEFTAPLVWSISEGTLPNGLSIDDETGVISGTPTVTDEFTFTVQAVDADGQTATSEQTVEITA
ncbi:MAG: Ig domain-containing protein [Panacagrimonas sp.]